MLKKGNTNTGGKKSKEKNNNSNKILNESIL